MNKTKLIDAIPIEAKSTKVDVAKAGNRFTTSTTKAFTKGSRIGLVGFSSFSVTKRVVRNGRNLQTRKAIKIAAKKAVRFKTKLHSPFGDLVMVSNVRQGIKQADFKRIATKSPFTLNEWSYFLNLSERTMQRYEKQKKTFAPPQSEKILEIEQLNNKGIEVFEDKNNFKLWIESNNIVLGGVKPKELLDTSIGIGMVKDELIRIEYGILA